MIALALVAAIAAAWLLRRWAHGKAHDAEQRRLTRSVERAKQQNR